MEKIYNLSLDLGTNSVGWAAVGQDYRIIKKGNRHLWGVVLFDKGQSAKARRTFRSARRRYERRRERIELLRQLTAHSVDEVDGEFFHRLDMSYLAGNYIDTKTGRNYRYNLFNGSYTDKQFYKTYPTIYHLRDALAHQTEKADIRLVYLAMHHIIKYRGNFLHDEQEINISGDGVSRLLQDAVDLAREANLVPDGFVFDSAAYFAVMSDKSRPRKERQKAMADMCGTTDFSIGLAKLLCGYQLNEKDLQRMLKWEDETEEKLQFGLDTTEEQMEKCRAVFGDEIGNFLDGVFAAYMEYCFVDILGQGNTTFSQAMIAKYNQHKEHLALLKSLLRGTPFYNEMFKSPRQSRTAQNNYAAYVRTSTKRTRYYKGCTQEEFYKYVSSVLAKLPDSTQKVDVLHLMECEQFMPRLNSTANGAVPYQLNCNELIAILNKQSPYYPELAENRDKIIQLLTFRRPYSVGVLKGSFSWIDGQIEGRVYPWNFQEKVDMDAANRNFIAKMLSKDPFFPQEYVLPLQSITYQRYMVLNDLNNLRYKGQPLAVDIKQALFDNLIRTRASVKAKDVVDYLNRHYNWNCVQTDFNFADEKWTVNTKAERDLRMLFGKDYAESDIPLYDKLIECLTVFKDVAARERVLGNLLQNHTHLKQYLGLLCKKNYAGWGRYSRRTLCEEMSTSLPARSILDLLYETTDNMQRILFGEQYGFAERLHRNLEAADSLTYEALIEPLYADAAVKKTVWQAYKVVREVVQIMGCEPQHIFVETTRETTGKGKTTSRRYALEKLYAALQADVKQSEDQITGLGTCRYELDAHAKDEDAKAFFDSERVYLYFLQMGRCMYTNTPLSLDRLSEYEVDHIIPRSYIKDDSIDNKVLVLRSSNQRKRDQALSDSIIQTMSPWWQFLHDHGFISQKKLNNLQRNHWDENALSGFINRQLVETTQINKCFAEVIYRAFPHHDPQSQYVRNIRARLGSEFRHMMAKENETVYGSFFKVRALNDLHHAKDAYLAGVLGTFSVDLYPMWGQDSRVRSAKRFLEEEGDGWRAKEAQSDFYGAVLYLLRNGHYTPVDGNGEVIPVDVAFGNICRQMDYNDMAVVHIKEPWANGDFYNQTIYPAGEGKIPLRYVTDNAGNRVPLDPAIYGGYNGEQTAYYYNIVYQKDRSTVAQMVGIPVQVATVARQDNSDAAIRQYLAANYPDAQMVGNPIFKYQLIQLSNQLVYIVAASEVCNARQLVVNPRFNRLLYAAEKKDMSVRAESWAEEDGLDFLREYVRKLRAYYPLFKNIAKKVEAFMQDGFADLSLEDKYTYIECLLRITGHETSGKLPKSWNNERNEGRPSTSWGRLNNRIIAADKVLWLDSSITGYYRTKK